MPHPDPRPISAPWTLRAATALLTCLLPLSVAACSPGESADPRQETVTSSTDPGPGPAPGPPDPTRPTPSTPGPSPTPPGETQAPSGREGQPDPDLLALVTAVTAEFGGTAGVAVSDGVSHRSAGELTTGPAWSTIKVPIAVAALRTGPDLAPVAERAISASDNDAAQTLWAALGTPEQAGSATQEILAEGNDHTIVNTEVTRPGFSSFGQTTWALSDQAGFAAHLPCLPGTEPVTTAMGAVIPGQDYGLGTIPGARYKGGWGPDETGAYLVRQFGVIPGDHGGHRAVAIAVRPASGAYTDGQAMLNRLAAGLGPALADLPAARC